MTTEDAVENFGHLLGVAVIIGFFACFAALPIGFAVWAAEDNADIHFVEKCVKAGAQYEACYKVVHPMREVSDDKKTVRQ